MAGHRNPSDRPTVATPVSHAATTVSVAAEPKLRNELKLSFLKLMLATRLNDETEQGLKRRGQGSFQMSSEGHEALGALALAMKPNDWLHPHYRDRALVLGRGLPHENIFLDFYGKANSSSGGRQMPEHYSSRELRIVSLSSPVATNLLQAVGMAMSLKERGIPEVVVASIGDASSREGEALEAFAQAGIDKLPLVFLIEDNGYGISTSTIGKTFWTVPNGLCTAADGTKWFYGCRVDMIDGLDPVAVYQHATAALERARAGLGSTCIVAKVERLKSHSSSDDQRTYRSPEELSAALSRDPVKCFTSRCLKEELLSQAELDAMHASIQAEIDTAVQCARRAPEPDAGLVEDSAFAPLPDDLPTCEQHLPELLAKKDGGMTMAQCIDLVLEQEMRQNKRVCLFGEDVEDPKGDVFGTTRGLSKHFPGRVINSPLAEATIIGSAVGRAILGDVPVAAIQFIDFMGPGLNQLFNEVVTMHWRSAGEWNCPMVMTAPYGAYLPGLGPWHSQTNEALYAHLPGLHVVIPSSPGDAAGLLRYALRCNRPVLFLYPKALLHGAEETVKEPSASCIVPFGQARTVREGRDVTLVTWGNCVSLCRAAATQAASTGVEVEILDLRTIIPWDLKAIQKSVAKTGRLMVVHEDAKTGGFGAEIITEIVSTCFEQLRAKPVRITKTDSHNPFNYQLEMSILPKTDDILKALFEISRQDSRAGQKGSSEHAGLGIACSATPAAPVLAETTSPSSPSGPSGKSPIVTSLSAGPSEVDIMAPRQSPTDEDATIVRYLVKVGQVVKVGTPLVEMEANKGSFEVESTHVGLVKSLNSKADERVLVESTSLLTLSVAAGAATSSADLGKVSSATASAAPKIASNVAQPLPQPVSTQRAIVLSPSQLQVGALALKSQLEIPTVSVECEVDISALMVQREALKKEFESRHGIKVTYTHFILWSLVQAMLNPLHEGFRGRLSPAADKLLVDEHVNVGFAAVCAIENLYSPVVKNADSLSFVEFVRRVQTLTENVRSGHILSADLQGASVTLTNIGAFEATSGTPFIIPGQLAMLTAGSILERPRFSPATSDNAPRKIEPHHLLNLKLVFDHRPFNGSHGAAFLRTIKHTLESLKLAQLL